MRDYEPFDDKQSQFEIDLRVGGVSPDAILQDGEDERNQQKVGKVQNVIMHEIHSLTIC